MLCAVTFQNMLAQSTTPLPPKESALSTWQVLRGGQQMEGVQYLNGAFSTKPVVKWESAITLPGNPAGIGQGEGEALVGDINGDGKTEVVQGSSGGNVFVFDGATGNLIWYRQGVINSASPVLADVNADGKMDVLTLNTKGLLLDGATGTTIWTWTPPVATGGTSSCPNVSDLDKDGIPEAVFLIQERIYVVNGLTGTTKWIPPAILQL